MSEKKMNIFVILGILGIDCFYLFKSFTARKYTMVFIGPYEFPKLIGIALAILCIVALVKELSATGKDGRFVIPNLPYVIITLVSAVLFVLLWQYIGHFYVFAPLFLLVLFFTYRTTGGRFSKKNIMMNIVMTAGIVLFIYFTFQVLTKTRL